MPEQPVPVSFIECPPGPNASASEIRRWLAKWFEERGIANVQIQRAIDKVWWNGKDLRSRGGWMNDRDRELEDFGSKWYSEPLANKIAEALKPEKVSPVILYLCRVLDTNYGDVERDV